MNPNLATHKAVDVGAEVVGAALAHSEPVEWPDPEPLASLPEPSADYPIDSLPTILSAAAKEVARFVKVPPASPAVVAVSVVTTALGKSIQVEERPGLKHYLTLFHLIVASSGERKSPVFSHMKTALTAWEEQHHAAWKSECHKVEASNTTASKMIAALEKDIKPGMDHAAREHVEKQIAEERQRMRELPPEPRLSTSDVTAERLFQMMHERDGVFAVLSGEGRPIMDAIMGRYSDGMMGDSIYLAGISGDAITRDRVGGDSGPEGRVIATPALNVCVMVQPDKLLAVVRHPALRASGVLARIWPVWLPSLVGTRFEDANEPGLNQQHLLPYNTLVTDFLDLRTRRTGKLPHLMRLSRGAAEARREWHNEVEARMAAGGDLADAREIASKAVSATVKLAAVFHACEHPSLLDDDCSEVDLNTWNKAQRIGEYHLAEAVRIQRLAGDDEDATEAVRVIIWIAAVWSMTEITARDVMQNMPRPRLKSAARAGAILQTLADHGYLAPQGNIGANRAVRYSIHPRIREFVPRLT